MRQWPDENHARTQLIFESSGRRRALAGETWRRWSGCAVQRRLQMSRFRLGRNSRAEPRYPFRSSGCGFSINSSRVIRFITSRSRSGSLVRSMPKSSRPRCEPPWHPPRRAADDISQLWRKAGAGRSVVVAICVVQVDLCRLPATDRAAQCRKLASEEALRPFDLAHGPLMRATLVRHRGRGTDAAADIASHCLRWLVDGRDS